MVYIQEAHASDGWQLAVNERENVVYEDPKAYEDRVNLAGTCSANLNIEFPALVDTIENTTEAAYTGWPDRLYLIGSDGRVAFKSEPGPFGFKVDLLAAALGQVVGPGGPRP